MTGPGRSGRCRRAEIKAQADCWLARWRQCLLVARHRDGRRVRPVVAMPLEIVLGGANQPGLAFVKVGLATATLRRSAEPHSKVVHRCWLAALGGASRP